MSGKKRKERKHGESAISIAITTMLLFLVFGMAASASMDWIAITAVDEQPVFGYYMPVSPGENITFTVHTTPGNENVTLNVSTVPTFNITDATTGNATFRWTVPTACFAPGNHTILAHNATNPLDNATCIINNTGPFTVPAMVVLKPETLNLKSSGLFTAFIALPECCAAVDVNVTTVVCEGAHAVRVSKEERGTYIAKFFRQSLNVPPGDEVMLTVTGELNDGTPFEGSDTIRVIKEGKSKKK